MLKVPFYGTYLTDKMHKVGHMDQTVISKRDWMGSLFSIRHFKQYSHSRILDLLMKVKLHGEAYDVDLHHLDGSPCKLSHFAKPGRPLVINFGSCSWPPFMAMFDTFCKMVSDFAAIADFVTVYIEEAHATDGWMIPNNPYNIKIHRTLEERLIAGRLLKESRASTPCPIVVDSMSDDANKAYGGLYERLYVVLDNRIVYQGRRGPSEYFIHEVQEWLHLYAGDSYVCNGK